MQIEKEVGPGGSDLYATDEHWNCGETPNQQLGVYVRIENFYEATGDARFKDCPWMVSFDILPHQPSEKGDAFGAETMRWIDGYAGEDQEHRARLMREHMQGYGATVTINRQIAGTSSPNEKLPTPKGRVEDSDPVWPMFEEHSDAADYAEEILKHRVDGLMGLVGFVLDAPVNGMGTTGWEWLRSYLDFEAA